MSAALKPAVLLVACLTLVGAAGRVAAGEDARPVADVASDAVAAHEAGNGERLGRLSREVPPDPWRVADLLCGEGRFDAAVAYALAAPRPAIGRLPTWVDLQQKHPTPKAWRTALEEAKARLRAGAFEEAIRSLEGLVDPGALVGGQRPHPASVAGVDILTLQGRALLALDLPGSVAAFVDAAHVAETMGWRREARRLADEATRAVGRLREAHAETIAWQTARAQATGLNVGLGRYEAAAPLLRERVREAASQDNWLFLFDAGLGLGRCLRAMGDLAGAESAFAQARKAAGDLAFDPLIATAIAEEAALAEQRGSSRKAIALREEAADLYDRAGVPALEESMRFANALLWRRLAEYPRAFQTLDRCAELAKTAGDVVRQAQVLAQIGTTYRMLGSHRKAAERMEQALALVGELGDLDLVAGIYQNLGGIQMGQGRGKEAAKSFGRALSLYTVAENPAGVAAAYANLGLLHANLGSFQKALTWRRRALETVDRAGLPEARAGILVGNGEVEAAAGQVNAALDHLREAAREAEGLEMPDVALKAHRARARVLFAAGRPTEALAAAEEALRWMPRVMGGLAEEESVGVRALHASVFDVGIGAALALGQPQDALHFLEAGRAGALLESLGGRALLSRAAIPADLARAESEARARAGRSRVRYREAVQAELLRPISEARKALDAATTDLERIIERVQRTRKAAAGLVYPRPATAAEIEAIVPARHVLALYAVLPHRILAMVLDAEGLRVVDLGEPAPILERAAAFDAFAASADVRSVTNELRRRLLTPLHLPADTETLVVSPAGPLAYVPFALLAPDLDLAYVPSGTTWVRLSASPRDRGAGVLALGDPLYRDPSLTRLPETRLEVESLGTRVLVGAEATEALFLEAVGERPRWRALHFACHGIVDALRPMRSALVFAPDEGHDGRFTVLDVLHQDLPADLAVLSACDTGRGRVVRAEGIVGLTRAFMAAGSPRVLCSLWKVDDRATRALMERFYALWNPEGGGGVDAASALRGAQESVRSQEAWRHPRYWAAWVLWGLPD